MPPPIRVEIEPYSATWPELAHQEMELLSSAFGGRVGGIHHIGSTSIRGLAAKPVIDLMAVAPDLDFLDDALPELDRLGFRGWGQLGITGRRYFTKDTDAGKRIVQLHSFPQGSPHVERHLAFRDYLRAHPDIASGYETEKQRCAALFLKTLIPTRTARRNGSLVPRLRHCDGIEASGRSNRIARMNEKTRNSTCSHEKCPIQPTSRHFERKCTRRTLNTRSGSASRFS